MLNGDQVDMMRAESDGVRQDEMRDAVSILLHPVSSWSAHWLTIPDVLTKYYHWNYNTTYINIISFGKGIYDGEFLQRSLMPVRILTYELTVVWCFIYKLT